jgi:hypothetical protein
MFKCNLDKSRGIRSKASPKIKIGISVAQKVSSQAVWVETSFEAWAKTREICDKRTGIWTVSSPIASVSLCHYCLNVTLVERTSSRRIGRFKQKNAVCYRKENWRMSTCCFISQRGLSSEREYESHLGGSSQSHEVQRVWTPTRTGRQTDRLTGWLNHSHIERYESNLLTKWRTFWLNT